MWGRYSTIKRKSTHIFTVKCVHIRKKKDARRGRGGTWQGVGIKIDTAISAKILHSSFSHLFQNTTVLTIKYINIFSQFKQNQENIYTNFHVKFSLSKILNTCKAKMGIFHIFPMAPLEFCRYIQVFFTYNYRYRKEYQP